MRSSHDGSVLAAWSAMLLCLGRCCPASVAVRRAAVDAAAFCCQRFALAGSAAIVAALLPPLEALSPLKALLHITEALTPLTGAGSSVSATRPKCGAVRKIVAENEGSSACQSLATPRILSPTMPRGWRSRSRRDCGQQG